MAMHSILLGGYYMALRWYLCNHDLDIAYFPCGQGRFPTAFLLTLPSWFLMMICCLRRLAYLGLHFGRGDHIMAHD
jgi:hypothetical protein